MVARAELRYLGSIDCWANQTVAEVIVVVTGTLHVRKPGACWDRIVLCCLN